MRIAMIASECEPYAKTGGLADVVDALSRALGQAGHEVDVYLPRYQGLDAPQPAERLDLAVPTGRGGTEPVTLLDRAGTRLSLRLVDHPPSFDRPEYYVSRRRRLPRQRPSFHDPGAHRARGDARGEPAGRRHPRPRLGGRAGDPAQPLRVCGRSGRVARGDGRCLPQPGLPRLGAARRGGAASSTCPRPLARRRRRPAARGDPSRPTWSTRSRPAFARESLTPEFGAGVDDALRSLGDRYLGIINGIDTELWNPATDAEIRARYSATDLAGKDACRAALCAELGLDPDGPLFAMVGRLDPQKGFDLVAARGGRICSPTARASACWARATSA